MFLQGLNEIYCVVQMPHSLLLFPYANVFCFVQHKFTHTLPCGHPHSHTLTHPPTHTHTQKMLIQKSNKSCALGIVNHNQNNRTNEANVPHGKQQLDE